MSLNTLNKEQLQEVADFFTIEVVAADADKGPSKKELLAALAAGSEPVTMDDYRNIFLVAKNAGTDKSPEEKALEAASAAKAAEEARLAEVEKAEAEFSAADDVEEEEDLSAAPVEEVMLVRYQRKNPSYEIYGQRFNRSHPYASVPASIAERLVREDPKGFRPATPNEVTDYYN